MNDTVLWEGGVPSLRQVCEALAVRMWADLQRLNTVLGMGAMHTLLGLAPSIDTPYRELPDLKLSDIDVQKFALGRLTIALHDFAVNGVLPYDREPEDFLYAFEHYEDFVVSLNSDLLEVFLKDLRWAIDEDPDAVLKTLYRAAQARFALEKDTLFGQETGQLELQEVALLAGMQLQSVRNATHGEGEDALHLYSANCVESPEARRWLARRRNFKPTVLPAVSAAEAPCPEPLQSLYELGRFMAMRWQSLGKTDVHLLLQELAWPAMRHDYLQGLSAAPHTLDLRDCPSLSRSLQVDEAWFTAQVMQLLYPQQFAQLQQGLPTASTRTAEKTISSKKLDRLCQRLEFEMRDGEKMYPVRMKNRSTEAVTFRLSEGGAGGNTKDRGIEEANEVAMIEQVVENNMAVRVSNMSGSRVGLYRPWGQAIAKVFLDGKQVIKKR